MTALSKFVCKSVLLVTVVVLGMFTFRCGADSLWNDSNASSMFADKRATKVGDIITIIVQETSSASKDASTKTSKKTSADIGISQFLYGPQASGLLTKNGQYPGLKYGAANEFNGGGQINNNERITARIAVRVIDVLPNKNLVVEGRRQTSFGGEVQDVVLRGVIRNEDVMANNTVYSYNVADVTINFITRGSITDSSKKGWFTKVWDKLSPF